MWSRRLLASAGAILTLLAPVTPYKALSDNALASLTIPKGQFDIHEGGLLSPILIPRVSGTEGNAKVQKYFTDFFHDKLPKWKLLTQNSTSKTPVTQDRDVPFTNLVFSREPPWAAQEEVNYLTLVAHFDSKYSPEGFIGATDSAAPCAMLLHTAQALDESLTAKWESMQAEGVDEFDLASTVGVQVILLDGEEAFLHWTATDSLYGARSLAETWENEVHSVGGINRLGGISLFVLLDLLGSPQPYSTVPSYFPTTHWAYVKMAEIEQRLRNQKLWASKSETPFLPEKDKELSATQWLGGHIEDDHIPFMAKGVEILHMITNPFPQVWHTMNDDGEHLDIPTVEDWAKLVTAFTAEWMELDGFLKPMQKRHHNEKTEL